MKELLEITHAREAAATSPFALASVVRVEGSSYRKPGARMLISLQGRVAGSVSGGCLERDVISKGLAHILDGKSELAVYDTNDQDDMAFGTSLGCEGRIEILIQPLVPSVSWFPREAAQEVIASRAPRVMATCYSASENLSHLVGKSFWSDGVPPGFSGISLSESMNDVLTTRKSNSGRYAVPTGTVDLLLERIVPPTRLVIFGGGHDVPPLVRLAKEVGYHVTVADRRADFAEATRFPSADAVIHAKPRQVRELNLLDERTAVVIMNHHYETDAELLRLFLTEPLAYLGMLGPRKRTIKILREFGHEGGKYTADDLAKVHAPVGLDLGSETPEQIALCILAEVQAVTMGRTAVSLRSRTSLADELLGVPTVLLATS